MCGIAGYKVLKRGNASKAIAVFEQIMLQSQIRGKHATGVAWVEYGQFVSVKSKVPAKEFLNSAQWARIRKAPPVEMIGHCRYSTSGEEAQPINYAGYCIVHNGMVSMAAKEHFEAEYKVKTKTDNDSEIILHYLSEAWEGNEGVKSDTDAFALAFKRLYKHNTPIFACAVLQTDGSIRLIRDHIRPLWFFYIKEWEVLGFASTQDIIRRAFKKFKDLPDHAVWEADPYMLYTLGPRIGCPDDLTSFFPAMKRITSFTTKPLTDKRWLGNAAYTLRGTDLVIDSPTYDAGDHRTNLRESFKRYCAASVATNEIDPNYPLLQYLFERYELSQSQQYWACWLYGVFYHPGTVFYVMQEFPEYELVDIERLNHWHEQNWKKLRYNKDRKYEKGHFVEMFESYVAVIGSQSPTAQRDFFEQSYGGTAYENFHHLWKRLSRLLRFGRYSLYIYTETLARCMGVPIEANTVFLKDSSSPRAGLCHVLGKPEWAKARLTSDNWTYLETEVHKLIAEVNREYPVRMDYWFMESCLCAYKGFFANGRYLGYYLDRMADEIIQMADEEALTSGIEWTVLWQFRKENFPWEYLGEYGKPPRLKIVNSWRHVLAEEGRMIGMWPMIKRGLLPKTKVGK